MAKMEKLKFRDLKKEEVEVRVQSTNKGGYTTLLLYKDARCDMNILDETVGALNWKREHTRNNSNCIVSIWDSEKSQWISKEDTGTESRSEAEKGLASDSFKRACFNWGIGRELYTAPKISVKGLGDYPVLEVTNLEIKDKKITKLEISQEKNGEKTVVYTYPNKRNYTPKPTPPKTAVKLTKEPETKTSNMDKKTFDALMKLSEIMKAKGIKEEVIKEKYKIKGSLKALEYNKVLTILNDLQ